MDTYFSLKYAAYYCLRGSGRDTTIETCRLLLDMGAHADWEDEIGKCVISSKYVPTDTNADDSNC